QAVQQVFGGYDHPAIGLELDSQRIPFLFADRLADVGLQRKDEIAAAHGDQRHSTNHMRIQPALDPKGLLVVWFKLLCKLSGHLDIRPTGLLAHRLELLDPGLECDHMANVCPSGETAPGGFKKKPPQKTLAAAALSYALFFFCFSASSISFFRFSKVGFPVNGTPLMKKAGTSRTPLFNPSSRSLRTCQP